MNVTEFQKLITAHYAAYQRELPWRTPALSPSEKDTLNPYYILMSELMLQQTQVQRVIPYYNSFINRFPTMQSLATSPMSDVLKLWQGLGYNRRAMYLHQAVENLVDVPGEWDKSLLELQKGIGPNTASAIRVYAYNKPEIFIETNVRSVYLHHFFQGRTQVPDGEILELIQYTMDRDNPRQWYWALMDYGSYLKNITPNPSRRSKHHKVQSKFEGSNRQLRANVLKRLIVAPATHKSLLQEFSDDRLDSVLDSLKSEGLINKKSGRYLIG